MFNRCNIYRTHIKLRNIVTRKESLVFKCVISISLTDQEISKFLLISVRNSLIFSQLKKSCNTPIFQLSPKGIQ